MSFYDGSFLANYYRSDHWQQFKVSYYQRHPNVCFICGHTQPELHHKNYERLYKERDKDVVALCATHHDEIHRVSRERGSFRLTNNGQDRALSWIMSAPQRAAKTAAKNLKREKRENLKVEQDSSRKQSVVHVKAQPDISPPLYLPTSACPLRGRVQAQRER